MLVTIYLLGREVLTLECARRVNEAAAEAEAEEHPDVVTRSIGFAAAELANEE